MDYYMYYFLSSKWILLDVTVGHRKAIEMKAIEATSNNLSSLYL